jgi:hypothetical protein
MKSDDEITIETVKDVDAPAFDIVFIHGLNGHPITTWTHDNGEFWPGWLADEFPHAGVHSVGYSASIVGKTEKPELNLHERAELMLQHLSLEGIGARPIAFIVHSLGGVTVKELLRTANESDNSDWKAIFDQTRLVVFFGTPHTGASLAALLKFVAPKTTSTHIHQLANDSGYLNTLVKSYRTLSTNYGIDTEAFYEKYRTGKGKFSVYVVDEMAADPGVSGCRPMALSANHIDMVKFGSKRAIGFRLVHRYLTNAFEGLPLEPMGSAFSSPEFSLSHPTDRRDLLQKLTDAGRQFEYEKANEMQNAFASRYTRNGLHESASTHDDLVLSEVQQRFTAHVYHGKICQGASSDEVFDALQLKVIDPICKKFDGSVSAQRVYEAVYYLTQKCHIRWDCKT